MVQMKQQIEHHHYHSLTLSHSLSRQQHKLLATCLTDFGLFVL